MVGVVCHEHVGGPRRWQFEDELLAGTMADFVARVIEAADRLRAERTLGQYREHVDELTRVEQALRRSGENLRIVLGAAPVALVLTRLKDEHVVLANERCAALFGVPLEEVVGQRTRDYYAVPAERDRMVEQLTSRGYLDSYLVKLKKRSGEEFWAEMSGRIVELDGQRCSLVGVHDVTAQKNLEAQLRELATRDSLTGAANRRHFVELLERERQRCLRSGAKLALCMLDADHFMAQGADAAAARGQALTVLDGSVNMQASIMSFADSFWLVAVVFLVTMPLILLLGKVKPGSTPGAAADAH
jgi:PAS domain S-box-containing protein